MREQDRWQTKQAAEKYKRVVDIVVPGRKEILDLIAGAATLNKKAGSKVLDIGCGHGDVAAAILEADRQAYCTLVDYSEEMLASSRERFRGNARVAFYRYDLNQGLPKEIPERQYDAVTSCFAIHHVGYENRVTLYRDIRKVLREGAVFMNGDMFRLDSPGLNEWEFDRWVAYMADGFREHLGEYHAFQDLKQRQLESFREMGDKPGTLQEMLSDLKEAGFRHVDCLYKNMNMAVVAAEK